MKCINGLRNDIPPIEKKSKEGLYNHKTYHHLFSLLSVIVDMHVPVRTTVSVNHCDMPKLRNTHCPVTARDSSDRRAFS